MLLKSFSTERARVPVPRTPGRPVGGRPRLARGGDCCYYHSVLQAPLAQLAEQRTLNPRVRGSSPWRRTRADLGVYHFRAIFICPICPYVRSTFARESRSGRGGLVETGRNRPHPGGWRAPSVR